ncbi:cytochrome P450 [Aspergillus karnatakaensis]|uniref:cytochrome P450 n=1 Tax=Aspergillus karnatakaensis TaxID=1810916 RepID=UPI003CCC9A5F
MEVSRIWLALLGLATALAARTIYRLYFHPLRHIPGPKLAAITHLYEFYFDIWSSGRFLFQIEKLHRQYGPIVRITPREIHISDPDFYEEIYAPSSRRREKDPKFVPALSVRESMISTINHEHHRFRRNILNSFFSKRSVNDLTPMIEERTLKLINRFEDFHKSNGIVQLDDAFAALTADIITYYCYGKLWGFLEDEKFRSDIRLLASEISGLCHINRFFPFIDQLIRLTPPWLMRLLAPGKSSLFDFQKSIVDEAAQAVPDGGTGKGINGGRTIYAKLLDPSLPVKERSKRRLEEESLIVLGAGTETTSWTLTIAAYYLARNPEILRQLRTELKQVLPTAKSTCTLQELEQLRYLTAVINEALRVATPIMTRMPRVAPDETLAYKNYVIPPGTPMSSSSYLIHRNATIFPNPEQFDPDRWIRTQGKAVTGERLDRYLTPFGKGSRGCLGINLAYAELYIALAYFIRRVDFELHDTEPRDIAIARDFIVGYTETGEPRVYAKVTRMLRD